MVEEAANLATAHISALATIVQIEIIILTKFSIYNDVWLKHYPVLRVWKEHVKKHSKVHCDQEKDTNMNLKHLFNDVLNSFDLIE